MDSKYTNPQSHRGMKAILSCLRHKDGNLGSLPVYHITDVIGKHAHNHHRNHHFFAIFGFLPMFWNTCSE